MVKCSCALGRQPIDVRLGLMGLEFAEEGGAGALAMEIQNFVP